MPNRAWVLNLDAELEFEDPHNYRSSKRMLGIIEAMIPRLGIAPRSELIVLPLTGRRPLPDPDRFEGVAWCPTPRALNIMAEHGVRTPVVPTFDVIRQVNHRAFAIGLVPGLSVETFVYSPAELDAVIRSEPRIDQWLLKRPLSYSGRGRRRIGPTLRPADQRFVAASFADPGGGLLIEPWVDIVQDYVLHGEICRDGQTRFGPPVVQLCDQNGAWLDNVPATETDLSRDDRAAIVNAGSCAADAMHKAGYWGPFGIDAYRWRDAAGKYNLRTLGEINARFTMGWWRALG